MYSMGQKKSTTVKNIFIIGAITASLFSLNIFFGPTYGGDGEWYIKAAEGNLQELIEPYAGRFLHPFLAKIISSFFSLDVYQGFLLLAVGATFLFFVCTFLITRSIVKHQIFILSLFLTPYFFGVLREIFQPDAFYIFLTAFFFLLLSRSRDALGLIVLFLLFLARESTILLAGMYAWFEVYLLKKKTYALGIVIVILISLYTVGVVRSVGKSNVHSVSPIFYTALKLPYNLVTNVFGIRLWTNTSNSCVPIVQISAPKTGAFGSIKKVGICGFDGLLPLSTLIVLLTTFGIMPLILYFGISRRRISMLMPWVRFALWYGIAHYFIGVIAGTGIVRIVGYGWPAFLIAAPLLMNELFELDTLFIKKIIFLNIFIAWIPFTMQRIIGDTVSVACITILVIVCVYMYAWKFMKLRIKTLTHGNL